MSSISRHWPSSSFSVHLKTDFRQRILEARVYILFYSVLIRLAHAMKTILVLLV